MRNTMAQQQHHTIIIDLATRLAELDRDGAAAASAAAAAASAGHRAAPPSASTADAADADAADLLIEWARGVRGDLDDAPFTEPPSQLQPVLAALAARGAPSAPSLPDPATKEGQRLASALVRAAGAAAKSAVRAVAEAGGGTAAAADDDDDDDGSSDGDSSGGGGRVARAGDASASAADALRSALLWGSTLLCAWRGAVGAAGGSQAQHHAQRWLPSAAAALADLMRAAARCCWGGGGGSGDGASAGSDDAVDAEPLLPRPSEQLAVDEVGAIVCMQWGAACLALTSHACAPSSMQHAACRRLTTTPPMPPLHTTPHSLSPT